MVNGEQLCGLTTALDLIQFEDDRRRRAKEEVEPVPEGPAVVRIRAAAPRLFHLEITRNAAASVAQNIRHLRELRPRNRPTALTLDEHEQAGKPLAFL